MFNYKTWKLYYPGDKSNIPDDPFPVPVLDPGVDENGNSITPDSLKKNMTIPTEAPANDLAKLLANMLGADPANKVEAASELIKYLEPISKLAIPDYSEAAGGSTLQVVESNGPDVTILDEDIGPDSPITINPRDQQEYVYDEPVNIVAGKTYFLEINGDGNVVSGTATTDREGIVSVSFYIDIIGYTFYISSLNVYNSDRDLSIEFSKSHFTLTTPSVIKKLKWSTK